MDGDWVQVRTERNPRPLHPMNLLRPYCLGLASLMTIDWTPRFENVDPVFAATSDSFVR